MLRYIFLSVFALLVATACDSTQDLSETIKNKAVEVGKKNPLSQPERTYENNAVLKKNHQEDSHRPTTPECPDEPASSRVTTPSEAADIVLAGIIKDNEIDRYIVEIKKKLI